MKSVFVSYSHEDQAFVDRMVADLRRSAIPATYDRWLLRVGDSIIEKISAAVAGATNVIAVLSPHSVESRWVRKELSLAMTDEVDQHAVRVLPALLRDCALPYMLADKLYADFRRSYFAGLRQILRALGEADSDERDVQFRRKESIERDREELLRLLAGGDGQALRVWFLTHGYAMVSLLGRLLAVSEAIPGFSLDGSADAADFLVVNGQSSRYDMSLVRLGPARVGHADRDAVRRAAGDLQAIVRHYKDNEAQLRETAAGRLEDEYGASDILRHGGSTHRFNRGLQLDGKLLCGRRADFDADDNQLRSEIWSATEGEVEVISYDRVLESIDALLSQR